MDVDITTHYSDRIEVTLSKVNLEISGRVGRRCVLTRLPQKDYITLKQAFVMGWLMRWEDLLSWMNILMGIRGAGNWGRESLFHSHVRPMVMMMMMSLRQASLSRWFCKPRWRQIQLPVSGRRILSRCCCAFGTHYHGIRASGECSCHRSSSRSWSFIDTLGPTQSHHFRQFCVVCGSGDGYEIRLTIFFH